METLANGVGLRDWDDFDSQRTEIYDTIKKTFASKFPQVTNGVRLELHDLDYADAPTYSIKDQKQALLENRNLERRLRGTWRLFDHQTNQLLEERPATVMRVPVLTNRGTFINGGSEYTVLKQMRLTPGVYTRRKQNGETEAHFNVRRGTGSAFRVRLEPESGLFKLDIGQSSLRLYSLLKDVGVDDAQLEQRWGPELLAVNRKAYDARVFDKAYARLVRRPNLQATREDKAKAIKDALAGMRMDREVLARTLPNRLGLAKQASARFDREDYEQLAHILNRRFRAGINPETTTDDLVAELKATLDAAQVSVNPEVLRLAVAEARKEQLAKPSELAGSAFKS